MKKTFDKQVKNNVRTKNEWISFRLTEVEKQRLILMMEVSGFSNKTDFIRFCIFDKERGSSSTTNLKKYWERVNHYMNKIKKETLNYEQEISKKRSTNTNLEVPTKKSSHEN